MTGLIVITPDHRGQWTKHMNGLRNSNRFQELRSGSGRLSLGAVLEGTCVRFPEEFRYGWDLRLFAHRTLLAKPSVH